MAEGLLRSRAKTRISRLLLPLLSLAFVALLPQRAEAFCGFYVSGADTKLFNNATQVVLMREGTRTVLSMQNNYQGPPSNFAMVVPVPVILQKENVKTLPRDVLAKVDALDAPRLVEYWEQDPCRRTMYNEAKGGGGAVPAPVARKAAAGRADDLGVTVEAQFTVGEYEVVILSAKDAGGLDTWLKQEKYMIPDGAEPLFRPYIQQGSKFFVARVDVSKVTFDAKGMATLSPLRFHYDSPEFSLPVRLGLVNSGGTQDLIIHILAKNQRYEVANYPNVTIPTNLDVSENARDKFGSFYAALFDTTLEKNPKAVVTEYSWDASTCDPCPGPALYYNDLATLGADVLPSSANEGGAGGGGGGAGGGAGGAGSPSMSKGGGRMGPLRFRGPAGFTITRLHARYSKEALGQDLVFKVATPIVGGRETRNEKNELEHGSTASANINNFQGRYAIRHPWGGPIECKDPVRGIWGGPPASHAPMPNAPKAAKDLAFVSRDEKLEKFMRSEIPELNVKALGAAVAPAMPLTPESPSGATTTPTPPASGTPAPSASSQPGATKKGGCGCMQAPAGVGIEASVFLVGLGAVLARRKRRRS